MGSLEDFRMRLLASVLLVATAGAAAAQDVPWFYSVLARQTLDANDGWASSGPGTSGGSTADAAHVFVVTNRTELVAALNGSDATPKIIFVKGTINASVDDNNQPLACADYAAGTGYTLDAYLTAFDPATWGRTKVPSGPLETARKAAVSNQQKRIRLNIPSNTTLIGVGDAHIVGAHVRVSNAQNVIIRNLHIDDAFDCFPQWDPTDGSAGNWNSAYDNISLLTATNVWVDHCEFTDGGHPDAAQPSYFGREFVQHDGELDITNASDLVTVSWNRFRRHDKVMLIGSSDSATADVGKLRVTIHHNSFENLVQRMPRVRFGQVHVYNNYYLLDPATYSYSWGVGVQSQIYAENNFFQTGGQVTPDKFISVLKGTNIFADGTFVDGVSHHNQADVVAAYNALHDPDLVDGVGWTPTFFTHVFPTQAVPVLVRLGAGTLFDW
jgi:pectate lyase